MAGIGFTLRKLARQDNLLGLVQAYGLSSLISTGPWLFTILSLGAVNIIGSRLHHPAMLETFRLVIIYNFCFSLVISSPVLMVATRFLADRIFEKKVEPAPGLLVGALFLLFAVQAPLVGLFYVVVLHQPAVVKLAAAVNFLLISGIWLVNVFVSALKNYGAILWAFGAGMLLAFLCAVALMPAWGAAGLLGGFNMGLAVILFVLIARILADYPYRLRQPFAFLGAFRRYWTLALSGLLYNTAIWADKWVMWFAPEAKRAASGLLSYPIYDGAMFLAYFTVVPAMAVFLMDVETSFFEHYQRFYRDLLHHAPFSRIRRNHETMMESLSSRLRNLMVLQGAVAVAAILAAPTLFGFLGTDYLQIGVFRLGVMGSFFHLLLLLATVILAYFDLRRPLVLLNLYFLVSNVVLSILSLHLGFQYYGYGYFLSCLTSALLGHYLVMRYLSRLPYVAFVVTNSSV